MLLTVKLMFFQLVPMLCIIKPLLLSLVHSKASAFCVGSYDFLLKPMFFLLVPMLFILKANVFFVGSYALHSKALTFSLVPMLLLNKTGAFSLVPMCLC